jgi:chromosome segregation ATPase
MMDGKAPVYVKVDEYKSIRELLDAIKERLGQARTLLAKVNDLKQQEDKQIDSWARDIEDIEERISSVDKTLLEPQA